MQGIVDRIERLNVAQIKRFSNWPLLPTGSPTHIQHAVSKGYFDRRMPAVVGLPPEYLSASEIKILAGTGARADDGSAMIWAESDITLDLSASGANGLDTGSEANNTWYYVWLCRGESGVCAVFSTSLTSPTLPAGYEDQSALLPFSLRNDNSGDILPFFCPEWRDVRYCLINFPIDATGPTGVLSNGTATTYTDVSLASSVPPISRLATLYVTSTAVSSSKSSWIRTKGDSGNGFEVRNYSAATGIFTVADILTDENQMIQYMRSSGGTNASPNLSIAVMGYRVTEV